MRVYTESHFVINAFRATNAANNILLSSERTN